LARFLVANALTKLSHLADAEHPRCWVGAAGIMEAELDFVWGLSTRTRQRSRSRRKQPMASSTKVLAQLDQRRPTNTASAGSGPTATLHRVGAGLPGLAERTGWLHEAKLDAILGASSRSHKSVRSGIRCWIAFVGNLGLTCHVGCHAGWFLSLQTTLIPLGNAISHRHWTCCCHGQRCSDLGALCGIIWDTCRPAAY
jgi:hypothetical protein